jgi:protein SCO1/2
MFPVRSIPRPTVAALVFALAAAACAPAPAQQKTGSGRPEGVVQDVGFDQHLGETMPLDVTVVDEQGRSAPLASYLGERPALFLLVYYRCPMLCNKTLLELGRSLKPLARTPGKDFDVIIVSIDPTEKPELAARKKSSVLDFYGRPETAGGWHFLTAPQASIDALAKAEGFRYTYNPATKQYAHAAGMAVLTPRGVISQYLFGLEFPAKGIQMALDRAAGEGLGNPISQALLFCYDYDPSTGKYTLTVLSLLRVLGVLFVAGLASLLIVLTLRDRHRRAAGLVSAASDATDK